jgi:hypothetical protein
MPIFPHIWTMHTFTDEEFLALVQRLTEEQYSDFVDYDLFDNDPREWAAKERVQLNPTGMMDLTNVKSARIREELLKCTNFRVGNFKLKVSRYIASAANEQILLDVSAWEVRHKTPNGHPCNVDFSLWFDRDARFQDCPWLDRFDGSNSACDLPVEVVVDIVRWLQTVSKLGSFV